MSQQPVLSSAERQFLSFALDLAADHMANRGNEFDDADDAALVCLRQLADEADAVAVPRAAPLDEP